MTAKRLYLFGGANLQVIVPLMALANFVQKLMIVVG